MPSQHDWFRIWSEHCSSQPPPANIAAVRCCTVANAVGSVQEK